MLSSKLKLLLLISSFAAVFLLLLKPPLDPDLGWHLVQGEWILKNFAAPKADLFSHTTPGYFWADSYWGTEVLMVLAKNLFGLWGTSLLFTLLATLALFLSLNPFQGKPNLLSFAVFFFSAILASPFVIGPRPQILTLFFFVILWLILQKSGEKPKLLFFLPPLFLIWANLHAGFLLGFLLLGLYLIAQIIKVFFQRSLPLKEFKNLFWASVGSLLATLINPYGWRLYQTILSDVQNIEIKRNIMEWLPLNLQSDLGFFFLIYLGLIIIILVLKIKKSSLFELLTLAVFSLLAFSSVRHLPLFLVLGNFFLVKNFSLAKLSLPQTETLKLFAALFFPLFILIFGYFNLGNIYKASTDLETLARQAKYPSQAVEFLKTHPQKGAVFNDYGWGGYLIWQLPQTKTFIDGRMAGFKKDNRLLLEDYLSIYHLTKSGVDNLLQNYHVSWTLTAKEAPLASYLEIHPAWQKIYEDEVVVIFTKR